MNSKNYIQFLGTGAGDYHTPAGLAAGQSETSNHGKALKLGGKNVRHTPSLFIAPDILVEFGNGTREQLEACGIPQKAIRHLVISHGHYDHFYPAKIFEFAAGLRRPLRIYGNTMVRDALNFAAQYRWDNTLKRHVVNAQPPANIKFKTATLEKPFNAGTLKVTPVLSNHYINRAVDVEYNILEQQALNFVFERDGKTVFYGLDSAYILPNTFEFLRRYRFDIAIFDATWCQLANFDIKNTGHHNYPMMEEELAQFRQAGLFKDNCVIVYSHLSTNTVLPHDEAAAPLLQKGITLAYDGLVLDF